MAGKHFINRCCCILCINVVLNVQSKELLSKYTL